VVSRDWLRREFSEPASEYGPIDGWWWEAGRLDRERMSWQLREFKDKGIAGTWFYARYLYDEPLASEPRYFSDDWWEFTRFAAEEQRRLGLRNFFSNWTALEFEQDAIRAKRDAEPGLWGHRLVIHQIRTERGGPVVLEIPDGDEVLDAAAYRSDADSLDYASRVALTRSGRETPVVWNAPGAGWLLTVIAARRWDLNYLGPDVAEQWLAAVLGEYDRRLPTLMGNGIEAFGPDEMTLLSGNTLVSAPLLEDVRSRTGLDPAPYLVGLFHDIGPKTEQIRCNYYDAMCSLLEEHFYQAPARWLHDRGMRHASISQLGDDPLSQTYHYGDFLRYLRSFDIPGNEDPGTSRPGHRRLLQTKLSSSIANLYGARRAVVLAHYCAGWGHTLEENLAWTNESYAKGMNLYSRHLGSYSLMGGWYEWVPPSDHFHHPYWRYWKPFADYVRRLSFILSQGNHRADVALVHPISTIHAHWVAGRNRPGAAIDAVAEATEGEAEGEVAEELNAVFGPAAHQSSQGLVSLADALYRNGIDFDVVDNSSLARATVRTDVLEIAGVEFRCLLLPPLTTIPIAVMELAKRFYDAGGTVGAFGRIPAASVENGRGDPKLRALTDAVFGVGAEGNPSGAVTRRNGCGGSAFFVPGDAAEVPWTISEEIVCDVVASEKGIFHTHRQVDGVDVYFLFNTEERSRDLKIRLRVDAEIEIWDPFTGRTRPVYRVSRDGATTEVALPMAIHEAVVLVCSPGNSRPVVTDDDLIEVLDVQVADVGTVRLEGLADGGGPKRARIECGGREFTGHAQADPVPAPLSIEGPLSFRLEPTMDNRWGDFRHPPSDRRIGAEARRFRYHDEQEGAGTALGWHTAEFDDSGWTEVTYSYGPYWWHLGPVTPGAEPEGLLERARLGDDRLGWRPYIFSKRFGSQREAVGGPGLEHLLGVSDNFLVLDGPATAASGPSHHYLGTVIVADEDTDCRFVFGRQPEHETVSLPASERGKFEYRVPSGTRLWLDGDEVDLATSPPRPQIEAAVRLSRGEHRVLLRIVQPDDHIVRNYAVFVRSAPGSADPYVPVLRWFTEPEQLMYDITPERADPVGWYRFLAPPGAHTIRLDLAARAVEAWVDGRPAAVDNGTISLGPPAGGAVQVALRVRQNRGTYGGAIFNEPVAFECGEGRIELGDWSAQGLASYSGIGSYTAGIDLTEAQLRNRVLLDLGMVKTVAEVFVNGQAAGLRLARPFRFDITDFVTEGHNTLTIKVANTLANHMSTYPTKWIFDGQTVSGLLGPVRVRFSAPVTIQASPADPRETP
jgi:alpha-L-rhamnosidase/Glycosyl hydrolases family 2, sugar binding domain